MDEDIGLAFLNNPFDSKREEPELPQSLGIFERLKSALRKVQDVSKEEEEKTVEPPAVEEAHGEEEALVIDDGQTDDAIAEVILNSDKEEVAVYAKQTDFISFDADDTVEEKEQDTTTTRQTPMRDEWKRGLSSNEIRDRNEEIIEKLTIVRDEPVWFNSRQKFHPQSSNYGGDSLAALFQEEILDFVEYMSPTDHEHAVREYIVGRVQSLVTSIWSDAQVKVFGSFHTKLYLPSSDMDLVVLTDPRSTTISDKTCLNKIAKAIEKSGLAHEGRVEVINAKVPIVKFTDSVGQFSVDISCNIANGITAAERMSELIKQHPALR